jgi:hypothetical protein
VHLEPPCIADAEFAPTRLVRWRGGELRSPRVEWGNRPWRSAELGLPPGPPVTKQAGVPDQATRARRPTSRGGDAAHSRRRLAGAGRLGCLDNSETTSKHWGCRNIQEAEEEARCAGHWPDPLQQQ